MFLPCDHRLDFLHQPTWEFNQSIKRTINNEQTRSQGSFLYSNVCIYLCVVITYYIVEYGGSTGQGCQSCSWSAEHRKIISPWPRSRLIMRSRETDSAVPSRASSLILRTIIGLNLVLTAYRWRSLPRVHRHRASKPQGSSERVLPWQVTMDQIICASLSHIHYWYEVGMLKIQIIGAIASLLTSTCLCRLPCADTEPWFCLKCKLKPCPCYPTSPFHMKAWMGRKVLAAE